MEPKKNVTEALEDTTKEVSKEIKETVEVPAPVVEAAKSDPVMMTLLEFMRGMQQQIATLQSQVASRGGSSEDSILSLASSINDMSLLSRNSSGIKFKTPTEADLLPNGEQVTYYSRGFGFCFSSYMGKNGLRKVAPYNPILFVLNNSERQNKGGQENVVYVCAYTTKFKSEVEFIESSPFFNSLVFRNNANNVLNMPSNEFASKFSNILSDVAIMSPSAILSEAKKLPGFKVDMDAATLRKLIASYRTEQVIREELEATKDRYIKMEEMIKTNAK